MNKRMISFFILQSSNSFWNDMKEGEEAIVQRIEREKEEAEAFARTLRPSKGSQEKSDVSIKLYVKQEKTAKGSRLK